VALAIPGNNPKKRLGIRLRYALVFALLISLFSIVAYRQVRKDLEARYREAVEENLVDQAQLLASLLSSSMDYEQLSKGLTVLSHRQFSATIYRYVKTQSHIVVYATDTKGRVVFHSTDATQIGQDYSHWRDVLLTLQGRYGARSTRKDSLDDNSSVLYVAAPILQNGKICGVLTVGKPVDDFRLFLQQARLRILWWLIIGSLVLVLLGILAGLWVTHPVRRLEADLAAKRYVEEYVQVLTHELKSPISAILGATEILEGNPAPAAQVKFLGNIRSEIQRMRDLVSMILQVAALERQNQIEKRETLELQDLMGNLRSGLEGHLENKDVKIQWPTDLGTLQGDVFLLTQALHNLLLNAIEYSPSGSTISFSILQDSQMLQGTIRDHGPGIPDYALLRLFEKFYSLPKPGTGRKGTGLGLAFAREVFRLHGGSITLRNAEDGGAEARWVIPCSQGIPLRHDGLFH